MADSKHPMSALYTEIHVSEIYLFRSVVPADSHTRLTLFRTVRSTISDREMGEGKAEIRTARQRSSIGTHGQ